MTIDLVSIGVASLGVICGMFLGRWTIKSDNNYWAEMTGHCRECKQSLYKINQEGNYEKK